MTNEQFTNAWRGLIAKGYAELEIINDKLCIKLTENGKHWIENMNGNLN